MVAKMSKFIDKFIKINMAIEQQINKEKNKEFQNLLVQISKIEK